MSRDQDEQLNVQELITMLEANRDRQKDAAKLEEQHYLLLAEYLRGRADAYNHILAWVESDETPVMADMPKGLR